MEGGIAGGACECPDSDSGQVLISCSCLNVFCAWIIPEIATHPAFSGVQCGIWIDGVDGIKIGPELLKITGQSCVIVHCVQNPNNPNQWGWFTKNVARLLQNCTTGSSIASALARGMSIRVNSVMNPRRVLNVNRCTNNTNKKQSPMALNKRVGMIFSLLVVSGAVAYHVFLTYSLIRGESVYFSLREVVLATIFLPLWLPRLMTWPWMLLFVTLSAVGGREFYRSCIRPEKWWSEGQCGHCGYSRRGITAEVCPECGAQLTRPNRSRATRFAVGALVASLVLGWISGIIVGEWWMQRDLRLFLKELDEHKAVSGDAKYVRQRAWPAQHAALVYQPGLGIHATD